MSGAVVLSVTSVAACMSDGPPEGAPFGPAREQQSSTPIISATNTGTPPSFGATVSLAKPPPPISGGTLALANDGSIVAVADPDRDRVYIVDLAARALLRTIQLSDGDEPGRVAFDASGRVHVALRSGNALVTIDPAGAVKRRASCIGPRGVAYDGATDTIAVACADGHLLRFPPAGGAATKDVMVRGDLRDVVFKKDGSMIVSTFRSAHLLHVDATGKQLDDAALGGPDAATSVAWRTIPYDAGDGIERMFTMAQELPVPALIIKTIETEYYGPETTINPAPCTTGLVKARVEIVGDPSPVPLFARLDQAVLPVDIATDGHTIAIVSAGSAHTNGAPQLFTMAARAVARPDDTNGFHCASPIAGTTPGQPIAVVFDRNGELVVQSREPAALYIMAPDRSTVWKTIPLASDSREDTGHAILHSDSGVGIACASCHAEGGDDGRPWSFDIGKRRTPSLRGTLAGTAPYHWDGSLATMNALVTSTFMGRMGGPQLTDDQIGALTKYLERLPAPSPMRAPSAQTVRGQALFASHGCPTCHSGAMMTNNATVDVDTGGAFQVPSLRGVAWRAPFLHDGCAATLQERFTKCATGKHGTTSDLAPSDIDDLVAYLETL
jgi:cytochrome c553/DNA-binding beta-propeller fold protein YncE